MNTAPIKKLRKSWRVHERAATETCLTGIFQRNLELHMNRETEYLKK